MGLLQKIFDKSAVAAEKLFDYVDNCDSRPREIAAALAIVPFGVALEATALAAKAKKKPLDTSKISMTGLFY